MKKLKTYFIIFFMLVFSQALIFGQEEQPPAPPAVPAEPAFDFDFQNFLKIDEVKEKELLKNLKEDLQRELKDIKKINKQEYFQLLQESQFKNMKLPYMVKRDKEMYERQNKIFELDVKTKALAAQYQSAAKAEQEKIKSQLRQKLNELFLQKEEDRKQEVERLQQELEDLQKSLQVRMKNKEEIITRRMEELLHEDKYMDWD